MGLLRKLFGTKPEPEAQRTRTEADVTVYMGDTPLEVKGESYFQEQLASIAGPRTEDGYHDLPVVAVLVREPDNPYDPNAVAVYATTTARDVPAAKVGHVNREAARDLAPVIDRKNAEGEVVGMQGFIRGGWDRGDGDAGSYGIWLSYDPADFS